MISPLVEVIMVNWRRCTDTLRALQSIYESDYAHFRATVVDNDSRDGSIEVIHRAFSQVKLIANSRNDGFAGAVNMGIRHALENGADYTLILNNDIVVAGDMLTRLVEVAERMPKAGIWTPKILYYDQPSEIWFAGAQKRWGFMGINMIGRGRLDSERYNQLRPIDYVTGCAMLVRRAVWEQIGLFDPIYFMYFEDFDLCERVRRAGYDIIYIPSARMWHKVSASTCVQEATRHYYYARYIVPFILRYHKLSYGLLPFYALWQMGHHIVEARHSAIIPMFKGLWDGVKDSRHKYQDCD